MTLTLQVFPSSMPPKYVTAAFLKTQLQGTLHLKFSSRHPLWILEHATSATGLFLTGQAVWKLGTWDLGSQMERDSRLRQHARMATFIRCIPHDPRKQA